MAHKCAQFSSRKNAYSMSFARASLRLFYKVIPDSYRNKATAFEHGLMHFPTWRLLGQAIESCLAGCLLEVDENP